MADKDELDSTPTSGDSAADPIGAQSHGSHALEPIEPAIAGVPAGADEPTFRDRERMVAEGVDPDDAGPDIRPPGQADSSVDDGIDEPADDADLNDGEGDRELVAVGATSKARTGDADQPATAPGREKKAVATGRQNQPAEKPHRTGPVKFLRESVSELQKVVYPTGQQLINYFIVVLIFVLFIIAIVSVLDLAFGKAIIAVFS